MRILPTQFSCAIFAKPFERIMHKEFAMTKQFFLRLVMAFGLMFGLHFSTPTLARVEGGEEPPIKLINARAEMGCHYPSCLHTDFSGDLQTTGSQSVLNATVKANLYNNGQLISSGLFNTQLPATIPGQLNHVSGIFDGVLYYQFILHG